MDFLLCTAVFDVLNLSTICSMTRKVYVVDRVLRAVYYVLPHPGCSLLWCAAAPLTALITNARSHRSIAGV